MRKLLIGNTENILSVLTIIAIVFSFVDALISGWDQMLMSEEGFYGLMAFVMTSVFTLVINLAMTISAVLALYFLADIRSLLIQSNHRE